MKLNLLLFFFSTLVTLSWAQTPNLSKYNEEIKKVEKTVKYFEVEKINDQFYMLIGGGGNVGIYISDENVVMVDNKYEIIEEVLMSSLREITAKPIKYIINTHYHHDHSDGNRAFGKMGIPIISHENAKIRMQKVTTLYGGIYDFIDGFVQGQYPSEALPIITYNSKLTLSEGGEAIEMYNFGSGHTDGDTIIYFKNANIMHTGDAFVRYGYPYVDLNNGGSIKGIIEVLGSIAALADDQTVIMPGHGNLSSKQDVLDLRDSLMNLYQKTILGLENGRSYQEIADSIEETLVGDPNMPKAEITKINYIKSIELELKN
ncbi:MBL fold metallo-hydrolase [Flavobacteriaceae bacterium]|nr:MBL fold metallo-hydrolase [Flavobacteriaceae bacterium]MDB9988813.1 MBL fold metallo-hydrolase [Flavobacteriaceae bacterium]|tara:strand:- start:1521 stop:2471 length:951 start_codon:yes stop_codon:yes gene_type:complete